MFHLHPLQIKQNYIYFAQEMNSKGQLLHEKGCEVKCKTAYQDIQTN